MLQCVALLQYVAIGIYKQITNTYESHQNGGGGEGGGGAHNFKTHTRTDFRFRGARRANGGKVCIILVANTRARMFARGHICEDTPQPYLACVCGTKTSQFIYVCIHIYKYIYINIYI